jgi:ABC-type antimicrobial peptide transport system permease subunit
MAISQSRVHQGFRASALSAWADKWVPRLVLAPSLAASLVFVYGFLLVTGYLSLTPSTLMPRYTFVGLARYRDLFANEVWWESVQNLAWFTGPFIATSVSIGLLLALAGIAAVLAQSVAQRTREIGIRMALGAERRDILGTVVGEGARLVGIGIGIGAMIALAATRVLSGLLYGISATDPLTFIGVIVLLAGSALGACLLVATRATAVDPLIAMRGE